MKLLVFPVLFGVFFCSSSSSVIRKGSADNGVCTLAPVEGPCRAHFEKWFHNATSHQCEQFVYGGCEGNDNRFESKVICEKTCQTTKQHGNSFGSNVVIEKQETFNKRQENAHQDYLRNHLISRIVKSEAADKMEEGNNESQDKKYKDLLKEYWTSRKLQSLRSSHRVKRSGEGEARDAVNNAMNKKDDTETIEEPKTTKATEEPKTTKATEEPKTTKATKGPRITKTTKGPKKTKATKGPKTTKATEGSKTTKATKGPRITKTTKGPKKTKATKGPKTTKATEEPKTTKATIGPRITKATKGPKTTKATEGPNIPKATKVMGKNGEKTDKEDWDTYEKIAKAKHTEESYNWERFKMSVYSKYPVRTNEPWGYPRQQDDLVSVRGRERKYRPEERPSINFAAIFLSCILVVVAVVVVFFNRQKLIGIISGGRSSTMANTRTLETNVEEAVPLMKKYVA